MAIAYWLNKFHADLPPTDFRKKALHHALWTQAMDWIRFGKTSFHKGTIAFFEYQACGIVLFFPKAGEIMIL